VRNTAGTPGVVLVFESSVNLGEPLWPGWLEDALQILPSGSRFLCPATQLKDPNPSSRPINVIRFLCVSFGVPTRNPAKRTRPTTCFFRLLRNSSTGISGSGASVRYLFVPVRIELPRDHLQELEFLHLQA
jgi:hypothetical protein